MSTTPLPGAPPPSDELARTLAEALAARGPDYLPRTHHLRDGSPHLPKYVNRLVKEASPYLLQHAHNPVDWHPWGDDAFAEARARGVPVFLSIGYATCHWCHVMEGESFEDETIAGFMNQHFVCIKVDREERPDVDAVYMSATQQLTGGGGWPMSVWLDHERQPFFAGTYFPPRAGARGARRGFLELLHDLAETWVTDPLRVRQAAASLAGAVRADLSGHPDGGAGATGAAGDALPGPQVIDRTVAFFKNAFDPEHGGTRRAPKFPSNMPVRLLLRHHARTGDGDALHMATLTLEKMAGGGMYDQLGGGFHRYSTDAEWLVPHFEKMLYDNALLAVAYAEAFQATGRPDFARVVKETLDYLLREMLSPEGGFYSATDADSEGEEGRFFVWSEAEIRKALGAGADRFIRFYGVTPAGNFEGHNILHVAHPDEAEHAALAKERETLRVLREGRVHPLRDDKILASWNGLAISALAIGGRILADERYVAAAARAADFVLGRMRGPDGRLLRAWKDGRAYHAGYLDDQAFVAAGLLDLFEATFEARFLREARALAEATDRGFGDAERGGWFMTAHDHEKLLAREKPDHDGAEPSGTSVALMNAARLAAFTSDDKWRVVAEGALGALGRALEERPVALTEALLALDFLAGAPREIAVVWAPGGRAAAGPLFDVLRGSFVPARVVAGGEEGAGIAAVAAQASFVEGKTTQGGKPAAYVCERGRCERPTTDPAVFEAQLRKIGRRTRP